MELRVAPGPAEVRLPEAPTTGYVWTLAEPPAGVSLTRSDYVPPPDDKAVGGQGERVFHFDVSSPGRYDLDFRLGRATQDATERRTVTLIAER